MAQDEVRPFHSRTRWVPAETDSAGAPELGVSFAMAARARRVVAESPPWVRHWRSCKRTRRRKTRESELGGVAPKVCSQTRRKLAKSKPSKTTFRPTPVSCGITERSLFCSIKSSLMRDFRVRSSLPVARPTADLSQPYAPPVGLSLAPPAAQGSEASPAARNTLDSTRIPRASKLLICGLFQEGRVLAQDEVAGRPHAWQRQTDTGAAGRGSSAMESGWCFRVGAGRRSRT